MSFGIEHEGKRLNLLPALVRLLKTTSFFRPMDGRIRFIALRVKGLGFVMLSPGVVRGLLATLGGFRDLDALAAAVRAKKETRFEPDTGVFDALPMV